MRNMLKFIYHFSLVSAAVCACSSHAEAQYSPAPDSIFKVNAEGQVTARSYFRYDEDQRQTGVAHFMWNKKTSEWVGTFKEDVTYDANGNQVGRQTFYWDVDQNNWVLAEKETASFDKGGRQTSNEVNRWNKGRNAWIGERKREDTFDAFGKRINSVVYRWDDDGAKWLPYEAAETQFYEDLPQRLKKLDIKKLWKSGEWVNVEKREYDYDTQTRALAASTLFSWSNGQWVPQVKTRYSKTASDNGGSVVVTRSLTYDTQAAHWVNSEKISTQLDSKGSEIAITRERWAGIIWNIVQQERIDIKYDQYGNRTHEGRYLLTGVNKWVGRSLSDKTYNEYGDVLSEIRLEWDTHNQVWKGVVNTRTEYSDMGDVIAEQRQKWDRKSQSWQPQSKSSFQYDEDHNKIYESTSSWNVVKNAYEEFFKGKTSYKINRKGYISEVINHIWQDGKWRLRQITKYY